LFAALLRVVLDHCAQPDGIFDSYARLANADAMRLLAEGGFIRINDDAGDCIRAIVLLEADAFWHGGTRVKHGDFKLGGEFWRGGRQWRCTDVGARTIVAICVDSVVVCSNVPDLRRPLSRAEA
jgi:hypothetical protein